MLERIDLILKIACGILALLLLPQIARFASRLDPLANVVVPDTPKWSPNPDPTPASTRGKPDPDPGSPGSPGNAPSTTTPPRSARGASSGASPPMAAPGMQIPPIPGPGASGKTGPPIPGKRGSSRPSPGSAGPEVPPAVQRRIERIVQSGVLGPVIPPPPMALLGIAGKDALLRAPDGQTGLLQEGGELGGIKLLRIGTNRVLVLEKGQQQELSIFGGFGSESLMPKPNENHP